RRAQFKVVSINNTIHLSAGSSSQFAVTLGRAGQRAVDHLDRILQAVDRGERAEPRPFLLPQQHLVEHVEPFERDTGLAVLGLALAALVEEWLAPADLVDYVLNFFGIRMGRQLCERIAQIGERRTLHLARLAEYFGWHHKVAIIVNCIADQRIEMGMCLRCHTRTITADEAP